MERVTYASLRLSNEEIDGVHIGHELSHATIAALLEGDDSDFNRFKEDLIDVLCNELIRSVEIVDNGEDISKDIKFCLKNFLIENGEEARNILGLNLGNFSNKTGLVDFLYNKIGDSSIVCELDFLKEKSDEQFVRLPYACENTRFNPFPKVCIDIVNVLFQLSLSNTVNEDDVRTIIADIKKYDEYSKKYTNLMNELYDINWYETDATCDGNDGFYAILTCKNKIEAKTRVITNDNNWKEANELRNRIFGNDVEQGRMTEMSMTTFDPNAPKLTIEHLPKVAAYCNENYNRNLICIDITAKDPQRTFISYDGKDNGPLFLEEGEFFELLKSESPIVLVHNYGYWTAVVDGRESTTPYDDLSFQSEPYHGCCPCNIC